MKCKKITIGIFLSLILIGIIAFSFNEAIKKNENSKLFELVGKNTLDNIIDTYVEPISIYPYNGGKPFCDYILIDLKKEEDKIEIYLWLLAQEYYVKEENLLQGTGGVFPAVLTIKNIGNDNFEFINCDISRAPETDESLKIFPKSIRKKALENSKFNEDSFHKIEKKANTYFNLNNDI